MVCDGAPTLMTLSFLRQSEPDMDMIWPDKTYHHAKCENNAKPIVQDFNMLFRRSCKGTHNHTLLVLELKPITVSLGCTC